MVARPAVARPTGFAGHPEVTVVFGKPGIARAKKGTLLGSLRRALSVQNEMDAKCLFCAKLRQQNAYIGRSRQT